MAIRLIICDFPVGSLPDIDLPGFFANVAAEEGGVLACEPKDVRLRINESGSPLRSFVVAVHVDAP